MRRQILRLSLVLSVLIMILGSAFCKKDDSVKQDDGSVTSDQIKDLPVENGNIKSSIENSIPGFEFLKQETFSCGEQTNTVKIYRHEKTGLEFVLIPGGSFLMGSDSGDDDELPVHTVTIDTFMVCRTEVTQVVWEKIMGTTPWKGKADVEEGADYPATCLSWHDSVSFCEKTCLRLPTEAEWEYVCRAGATTKYYFGNSDSDLFMYCNYCDQSNTADLLWQDKLHNDGHNDVAPVMSYKPNAFGIFDMLGNVGEWCQDQYHDSYSDAPTNGASWESGDSSNRRVYRGGCWNHDAQHCRPSTRHWDDPFAAVPGILIFSIGFRPAFSYPSIAQGPSIKTTSMTVSPLTTEDPSQPIELPAQGSENQPRTMFIASTTESSSEMMDLCDRLAVIWEIRLDRGKVPVVLRHPLGPSSWPAVPLLNTPKILASWKSLRNPRNYIAVPFLDSAELLVLDTWAKKLVPGRSFSSCHKIFKVKHDPFEVKEVFKAKKIDTIGRAENLIYLETTNYQGIPRNLLVFDCKTCKVTSPDSVFELIVMAGDQWLVDIEGEFAIFDAEDNRVIKRFSEIPNCIKRYLYISDSEFDPDQIFWDGGKCVVSLGAIRDEEGNRSDIHHIGKFCGKIVYQEMTVWDLIKGLKFTRDVRTKVTDFNRTSSVYIVEEVIPVEVEIDKDQIRYTERYLGFKDVPLKDELKYEGLHEWVTIDIESGKELWRQPYSGKKPSNADLGIPEYLRKHYDNPPYSMDWWDRLAYAFLAWNGVSIKDDYYSSKLDAVAWSSDGREWLILDNGRFYYGNLETRFLYQWPAPASLNSDKVELYAIDL